MNSFMHDAVQTGEGGLSEGRKRRTKMVELGKKKRGRSAYKSF